MDGVVWCGWMKVVFLYNNTSETIHFRSFEELFCMQNYSGRKKLKLLSHCFSAVILLSFWFFVRPCAGVTVLKGNLIIGIHN